ncbi:S9 family peptidase [Sphingomonas sp. NSE70-1]|uniref:S9 family peptidase n=1 Tax=Sphingomonas caseinilyticus TaxID=2908205 RepID=A0ABT0RS59_9SPHN|nr:S9 family peptidase [Sphingomonas caseinilyticus]MCL6697850.1 S9 family peptidase [Sphingomonas caseinilyticus]
MPLNQAARQFGVRESAWAADLSPSGRKLVFLSAGPGSSTIAKILDLDTKQVTPIFGSSGKPESLEWCEFATETQLICMYTAVDNIGGVLAGFSKLVTLRSDGTKQQSLGSKRAGYDMYIRQSDGSVLDWLPDNEGSVLMARTYVPKVEERATNIKDDRLGLGVDRVELATLRSKVVEEPKRTASRYMSDGRGNVRIMAFSDFDGTDNLTGIIKYRYRTPGDQEWKPLGNYNTVSEEGIWPVAVEQSSNSAYVLENLNGRDALYRVTLDGSGARSLVASNDKVDIDGVVRIDRGLPVIGYSYTDDRARVIYFDPEFKKLGGSLSRALPTTPLIDFVAASRDAKTLLVHASADTHPGTFYVLNRATKQMEQLLLSREQLDGQQLAPVQSISFPAADGKMIPAYLTMSKDGPAKGRPAVVLPHGGPSARDSFGFDWLAQFLASRGYAVIQPNYRGSAGYGEEFLGENAFRDWKKAMSDISASAQYLVNQGIADAGKLAIVGWSYGGYAALQSATLEPDRYKAVVAIAPVTDLSLLRRESDDYINGKVARDFIGSDSVNLRQGSPLQNASRIKAPVLLVHGDLDLNVRIAHSTKMADALQKAGTPVELVRYQELEHQLDDSNARAEMLMKIGQLLDRTIGN